MLNTTKARNAAADSYYHFAKQYISNKARSKVALSLYSAWLALVQQHDVSQR